MSTPESTGAGERRPPRTSLSPLLTAATFAVLLLLGALLGLLSTTGAGWLTRYWDAGRPATLLSVAGLVAFLALLYGAGRLCAWGTRGPSGAVAFAVGFLAVLIALVSYLPGGDAVLRNHLMHNAYMFGTMLVLAISVVRSGIFLPPAPQGGARQQERPPAGAHPPNGD
ncbi:hypothetical protein HFP72_11970 [Nocardiopsis sp. ARC36]